MYLQPAEAMSIIEACAQRFPGGQMLFDLPPALFARWARRGVRTSRRYRVPSMPFSLTGDELANLVDTVPGITAVHHPLMGAENAKVRSMFLRTLQRLPAFRHSLTLLDFG